MSELDELLARERARRRGVVPDTPGFEGLRERGMRLRRRRRVAAAGGAALAVVGVLALGQLVGGPLGGDAQPVAPTPSVTRAATPTPEPSPSGTAVPPAPEPTTPDETVDHPAAQLVELVVSPGNPDARVAVWSYCEDGCLDPTFALAVTGDGFATRTALEPPGESIDERPPMVTPLTEDAFSVISADGASAVLRTDGSATPVRTDRALGPLRDGEVLVQGAPNAPALFMALDPGTARMHPLSVAANASGLIQQPDGTLQGVFWSEDGVNTLWSEDGGASWNKRLLGGDMLLRVLPSARKGTLAVLEGEDGATLFPLVRVHRSTDGGTSWQSFDLGGDPQAYGQAGGVLPDGRLLVDVQGWSDDRLGRPGKIPRGLHVSDGRDWSRLSPVEGGEARSVPKGMLSQGRNVQVAATFGGRGAALVLTALPLEAGEGEVSTDGGRTWERVAAR